MSVDKQRHRCGESAQGIVPAIGPISPARRSRASGIPPRSSRRRRVVVGDPEHPPPRPPQVNNSAPAARPRARGPLHGRGRRSGPGRVTTAWWRRPGQPRRSRSTRSTGRRRAARGSRNAPDLSRWCHAPTTILICRPWLTSSSPGDSLDDLTQSLQRRTPPSFGDQYAVRAGDDGADRPATLRMTGTPRIPGRRTPTTPEVSTS